jgi:dynein heavy chain 2
VFRPLANKGSRLFIFTNDLQKVNNMYRFSLASFIKLFKKCLDSPPSEDIAKKLEANTGILFRLIFNNIGTSLFKQDRLMFGLHIVKGMRTDLFEPNEWEFFLGNAIGNVEAKVQFPKWAGEDRKEAFMLFGSIFGRLLSNISIDNKDVWGPWFTDIACERNFPAQTKGKLSSFQKVLLVQVFRPDRVESALALFVCEALVISNISSQSFSLKNLYGEDSSPEVPILFVTSPGSDPSKELEEFAESTIGRDNFQQLSMGGNQNEAAVALLKEAAQKGYWVCFKNLHLVTSWLPMLEKELKSLNPHKTFRLWLTTEPHIKFPAILLESCHKVTYEAPPGIKKNLQRIYGAWTPQFIEQGTQLRAQMYFVIAWFHAVIQERRTYIPQGWSKFYEFSYGDLKAGCAIIDTVIEGDERQLKWETLYGLLEFAIYGGRVDNETDQKVLRAYLEQYYNYDNFFQNKKIANQFSVPQSKSIKDYLMLINKFQDVDTPNIFGLPMNIDRSVQRFNTTLVTEGMKKLATGGADDLKFDREKWSTVLGPLIKLWKNLHKQVTDKGLPRITDKLINSDDPVESFIYTEAFNCYQMLEVIDTSIEGINKVIYGSGLLTSEIQNEAMELLVGNLPAKWITIWDGPNNPNSWVKGFAKRAFNLKQWIEAVKNGNLLANELYLAELYHPDVFLNAIRQKTSRKINCPIDSMKLAVSFEPDRLKSPIVIKVRGLLIQGCGFDGAKMVEPGNDLPEFITLPTVYMAWNAQKDADPHPDSSTAVVPLYISSTREKMLCKLKLPNQGSASERIIGGVAVLISEDE